MVGEGIVVEARAPGKVILSGEHAVVHGSSAVAASLGLYATASISSLPSAGTYLFIFILLLINPELLWIQSMECEDLCMCEADILSLCCIAGTEDVCVLDLPQLGVYFKWPLNVIEEIVNVANLLDPKPSEVTSFSESELPKLSAFVEQQLTSDSVKGADAAVTAFLFLYASIVG